MVTHNRGYCEKVEIYGQFKYIHNFQKLRNAEIG